MYIIILEYIVSIDKPEHEKHRSELDWFKLIIVRGGEGDDERVACCACYTVSLGMWKAPMEGTVVAY